MEVQEITEIPEIFLIQNQFSLLFPDFYFPF